MSFDELIQRIPEDNRDSVIDEENQGVDVHLSNIADSVLEFPNLSVQLGLKQREIADIEAKYKGDPAQQRRACLRLWKARQGLAATYSNLLKACCDAKCMDGARAIVELWSAPSSKMEQLSLQETSTPKRNALEGMYIQGFKYASDSGSKARRSLTLYKPPSDGSYKYLGVSGNDNKILVLKETSHDKGALHEPIDWHLVWNDRGSGNWNNYSCWMPVGPPGYVALGVYCRFKVSKQNTPPSKEDAGGLVVVHKSLVEPCILAKADIWSDAGSLARHNITFGQLPHMALWPHTSDPKAGELPSRYTIKNECISITDLA